jgi:hypothetical protein
MRSGQLTITESDRILLEEIEDASEGSAWAILMDAGTERAHVLHISAGGQKQGIFIDRPTLLYARNLSVLADGCVALWSDNRRSADFLLLPPFPNTIAIKEHVSVLPVNSEGLPLAHPTYILDLVNAVAGARSSRIQVDAQ